MKVLVLQDEAKYWTKVLKYEFHHCKEALPLPLPPLPHFNAPSAAINTSVPICGKPLATMQINAAPLWGINYPQDESEATEILMIPEQNHNSAVGGSKVVVVVAAAVDVVV